MDNPELVNKVDKYDLDAAVADLSNIIGKTAEQLVDVKKLKFKYLVNTCELYTRMDYPSIMMDVCESEVKKDVPNAKSIRSGNFM